MATVRFVPSGKSKEVRPGGTILSAANKVDMPIGQSCMGDGICGWCRVTVLEGSDQLAPPSQLEKKLIREKDFKLDERAACLAKVQGDVVVTTTYW